MRFFWLRCVFPFRSFLSLIAARCNDNIQKYLGIWADSIVVLFSVLVYELAGPTLTKIALTAAGEIRPEGRTSARVENKPEEVAQKVVFCRNVTQSLTNHVIFCILSISRLEQFSCCVMDWLLQENE